MRAVRVSLIALAFVLVAAPAARADTAIQFFFAYHDAGPRLAAVADQRGAPTGVRVVEWRTCPPDGSACTPLPASAYEGSRCPALTRRCELTAEPGPAEAGTVFEAVFDSGGVITTRRTAVWRGELTSTAPPTTAAAPAVGQPVSVVPGSWSGGWDPAPEVPAAATSWTKVTVCRDLSGTDCWDLGEAPQLPERWAGWYLYAEELRGYWGTWSELFPQPISGQIPRPTPMIGGLRDPGPMAARSAPVQICCVPPAPTAQDAPVRRPAGATASVRARPLLRNGRLRVASVRCPLRCRVQLSVKSRAGTYARSLAVQGTRSLSIPRRRGQLRVRVVVDGKLLASGRSRVR